MAAEGVFDEIGALVKASEPERAEVDVPLPVVDLDEAEVFAPQRLTHIHPARACQRMPPLRLTSRRS